MKRGLLAALVVLVVVAGVLLAVPRLRQRAHDVASDLKLIQGDTGDVMASANYQRYAARREAVENMRAGLRSIAAVESAFVADSGRPTSTLLPEGRYAFTTDPANLISIEVKRDRWVAQARNTHTSMSCSVTAMLDTTTWRYHPAEPVCAEWTAESIAIATAPAPQPAGQDQPPQPRVVDLVSHPRPVNNTPPPMPWIQEGICPGRDCTFGQWTACSTIVATRDKRHNSPAVFTLRRGEEFTAMTGDVHVSKPGLVVFRGTFSTVLEKQDAAGPVVTIIRFTPADTLYPLLNLADRQMVLWFHGAADTGADFWRPDPAVYRPDALRASKLIESPTTTWWIRIRNSGGQEGWAVYDFDKMWTAGSKDNLNTCQREEG